MAILRADPVALQGKVSRIDVPFRGPDEQFVVPTVASQSAALTYQLARIKAFPEIALAGVPQQIAGAAADRAPSYGTPRSPVDEQILKAGPPAAETATVRKSDFWRHANDMLNQDNAAGVFGLRDWALQMARGSVKETDKRIHHTVAEWTSDFIQAAGLQEPAEYASVKTMFQGTATSVANVSIYGQMFLPVR